VKKKCKGRGLAADVLDARLPIFLDFPVSASLHSGESRINSFDSGKFAAWERLLRGQAAANPGKRSQVFLDQA
jgi:hypothetical protein